MSSDNNFIPGLFFKDKHENAPDFVICKGSVKVADMAAWLSQQPGEWVNFDLKRSRDGKPYAQIDTWKPDSGNGTPRNNAPRPQRREPERPFDEVPFDDDIPFATNRGMY